MRLQLFGPQPKVPGRLLSATQMCRFCFFTHTCRKAARSGTASAIMERVNYTENVPESYLKRRHRCTHFKMYGRSELHNPRINISAERSECVIRTCFFAFASEPLLAMPLPHVDVPAAWLGERLPADSAVMRLLTWEVHISDGGELSTLTQSILIN